MLIINCYNTSENCKKLLFLVEKKNKGLDEVFAWFYRQRQGMSQDEFNWCLNYIGQQFFAS